MPALNFKAIRHKYLYRRETTQDCSSGEYMYIQWNQINLVFIDIFQYGFTGQPNLEIPRATALSFLSPHRSIGIFFIYVTCQLKYTLNKQTNTQISSSDNPQLTRGSQWVVMFTAFMVGIISFFYHKEALSTYVLIACGNQVCMKLGK